MKLRCRDRWLSLDRPAVMGVLNVTPDSFSDGGLWMDPRRALDHGFEMVEQGATIVDVGGESTRPGAVPVEQDEELRRVIPVIEGLTRQGFELVSIDTRKRDVAERALEAGAVIVNDTTGEESDGSLDAVAAESGAAMIVMHSRGTPATMRSLNQYGDVVTEVRDFLARRAHELEARGIPSEAIVLDPGIGFAKDAAQSLTLLRDLDQITSLGPPVLVGTSRKSFIGAVLELDEDQRLEGTLATVAWSLIKGARIVRVHDVGPVTRAVAMIEAIVDGAVSR